MTITANIPERFFPCVAQFKDGFGFKRDMDSFKINYTSGKRVYITPIENGRKICEIIKNMIFDNGLINIKQGKQIVTIGTYTEE